MRVGDAPAESEAVMDLFERYLHAVRGFLPARQQDDVIRELGEDLRSQVEEREAELGRPLNAEEQEQILRHLGHPWLLASRYQPSRQLVGAALYPFYLLILKVALGVAFIVQVIAAAVLLANGRPLDDAVARLIRLEPFLMPFAWVTLVFAVLDRTVLRLPFLAHWNPSSLPAVPSESATASMQCRIAEVVMAAAFLLWVAAVPRNQWLVFGPAWTTIELGPPWLAVHVPFLVLVSVWLVVLVIGLRHPEWKKLRVVASMLSNIATLALIVYLLKAPGDFVVARSVAEGAESAAALIGRFARVGLGIATLLLMGSIAFQLLQFVQWIRLPGNWSPRRG
jgi:hypothetical protein